MTEAALYRLMAWLSPSFPVGAFSYSHGLEAAVECGAVGSAANLAGWLADCLEHGAGRNDAILLAEAMHCVARRDRAGLAAVIELAAALSPAAELRLETMAQGSAFQAAIRASWPCAAFDEVPAETIAYPVSVGIACAGHSIGERQAVNAYLHAFAANLVSAGVRLIPLGQTAGQQVLAALEATIHEVAANALDAGLDDLGGATLLNDLCAMRHETQYMRLFRS